MKKTYLAIVCFIAVIFCSNLTASNYKLGDFKSFYGNRLDYYNLGNGQFQDYKYFDSMFPDTEEAIDFVGNKVTLITKFNDAEVYHRVSIPLDTYFDNLFAQTFDQKLYDETIEMFMLEDRNTTSGLIPDLVFDLPKFARSKTVRRIFGDKAGRLSFYGSERLTISATSTQNDNIGLSESGSSTSLTPKMEQKLNMQLKGTIGEKIHVDLKYNSDQEESFFDPNNINIRYEGFEDEIVQKVEAGDISLSLPGNSQFVGSISSSQGLFGIRTDIKVGDLEMVAVMSQEEGQKNKKTFESQAQADSSEVNSKDYTRRTRYYIVNPYKMFMLYQQEDTIPGSSAPVPAGWVNNAIKMDENGSFLVFDADLLPADGSLEVYLDDADGTNNTATIPGFEEIQADNPFIPNFDILVEGTDYIYDYDSGELVLLKTINKSYTIGVRYTQRNGVQIPTYDASNDDEVYVKLIRVKNQSYLPQMNPTSANFDSIDEDGDGYPDNRFYTWHHQVRNTYSLNAQNINNEGFSIRAFREDVDGDYDYDVPDDVDSGGFVTLNDYLRLDTNGDGTVDGSDTSINLSGGYVTYPMLEPFSPLGDTLIYQEENESIYSDDYDYQMVVKGKIGTDEISLNQTNILRGSVTVKVNGIEQKENIDYIVDYDFGRVTFLTSAGKDPNAKIEIDFEFKSGFGLDKRQMFGLRADYKGFENFTIGSTFIYRTETVQDKHPKIGEENFELMLADIDASYDIKPRFMTDMVDWLPLIETDAESKFSLSGEIAVSVPNIYGNPDGKKKEAYVDDMESILDEYPLGVTRKSWVPASKPSNTNLAKGRTHWFNPDNVLMKEVYDPSTMDTEEETEEVSILSMKIVQPEISSPNTVNRNWGGVMKYIGNQIYFSEKKYVEVLAKIDTTYGAGPVNVTMHVDLGDISEDFYTFNGGEGYLNTEDGIEDDIIDGILDVNTEDVGLDGVKNGLPGDDPLDESNDDKNNDGDYLFINGTEDNNALDTEDLDGNGTLNTLNRYFEYSIPLSSDNFEYLESEYRGWKLFRIPIKDTDLYSIVSSNSAIDPTFSKISYARLWFEVDKTVRINVAEVNIVGNKWEERPIMLVDVEGDHSEEAVPTEELLSSGTSILAGITDNQKDTHYTPPKGTYSTSEGEETLEQSLNISITNLQEEQYAMVRQKSTSSSNYLLYNSLKLWVYPELEEGNTATTDSINVVFRVGADSLNYYEVKEKVAPIIYESKMFRSSWKELEINFSELTELKNLNMEVNSDNDTLYTNNNRVYRKVGEPTLSNVKELNLGIEPAKGSSFTGKVYFNDIRVTDPYEDAGYKARVTMNSKFADFYSIDVNLQQESENFLNEPKRNSSSATSVQESTNLTINNSLQLHKFLNEDWKYTLPLTFKYTHTESTPRYKASSDILRDDLSDEEKDRERNESNTYNATWSFRKGKTNNPWMDYTLGNLTVSSNFKLTDTISPTRADTTYEYGGSVSYNMDFSKVPKGFGITDNLRLSFFPSSVDNTVTFNAKNPHKYTLTRTDTLIYWKDDTSSSNNPTRKLNTSNVVSFPIVSGKNVTYFGTTYSLETTRDLTYKNRTGDYNLGEETDYKQTISYDFEPRLMESVMSFSSDGTVSFSEDRSQKSTTSSTTDDDDSDEIKFKHDGNVNRTINGYVTLNNSDLLESLANWLDTNRDNDESNKDDDIMYSTDKDKELLSDEDKEKEADIKDEKDVKKDVDKEKRIDPKSNERLDWILKEIKDLESKLEAKRDKLSDKEVKELKDQIAQLNDQMMEAKHKAGYQGSYQPKKDKEEGDKEEGEEEESNGRPFGIATVVRWLSGIENIDFDYKNTYKMIYSNLGNRPDFKFQLGLPYTLDGELVDTKENNNEFSASTGYEYKNFDISLDYSYSNDKRWSNSPKQTIKTVFPDVTFRVNDIQGYLGFGDILTSSSITTNYRHEVLEDGDINFDEPDNTTTSTAFSPLLSWRGNWIKNIQTNVAYNHSVSKKTVDKITFDYITDTTTQSVNGSIDWSFKAVEGIKIPLIGSSIKIKNDMTLSTDFSWEKHYSTNKGSEKTTVKAHTIDYTFSPGASYNFHKNIKGGTDFSYSLSQNKKTNRDVKTISFALWVEITF
jgi:hypothetical protein